MTSQSTQTAIALPATIKFDMQPYGCRTLGDLCWDTETERDWSGGPDRVRTILRGTVIEGQQRSYLFGQVSVRDITGEQEIIYGVRPDEIARGLIVRIAG